MGLLVPVTLLLPHLPLPLWALSTAHRFPCSKSPPCRAFGPGTGQQVLALWTCSHRENTWTGCRKAG